MSKTYNWGILGCGTIAGAFAKGLQVLPNAALAAVGSRDKAKAKGFGKEHGSAKCYGSYEDLVNDSSIDVVYIATPHPFHKEHTILCLEHGKDVLCEKPMAVNHAQGQAMIKSAKENGLFFMEAHWTRFLPVIIRVREWLMEGLIGEPRMVSADFGSRFSGDSSHRLVNADLAGGALLDVGCYTISFSNMVFGKLPVSVQGHACIGLTGVDEQNAFTMRYDKGELASCSSAVSTNTPHSAHIYGTEGSIFIPDFWHATKAYLRNDNKTDKVCYEQPFEGTGYNYEAAAVMECLEKGKKECTVIPHNESLSMLKTMDTLRAQWGLKYPFE